MSKQQIKVNLYSIINRAVEEGIAYGWNRSHKHDKFPTENVILGAIEMAVMNELSEVIDFGDIFGDDDAESTESAETP